MAVHGLVLPGHNSLMTEVKHLSFDAYARRREVLFVSQTSD